MEVLERVSQRTPGNYLSAAPLPALPRGVQRPCLPKRSLLLLMSRPRVWSGFRPLSSWARRADEELWSFLWRG